MNKLDIENDNQLYYISKPIEPKYFFVKTIDNFLNQEECQKYIKIAEESEYKNRCTDEIGVFSESIKNFQDAEEIFKKVPKHIKEIMKDQPIRLHDTVILTKTPKGKSFRNHIDTPQFISENTKERSKYRLLVYLNNCEGGTTKFLSNSIEPKIGRAVIFEIDNNPHSAETVLSDYKYTLTSDIVCM